MQLLLVFSCTANEAPFPTSSALQSILKSTRMVNLQRRIQQRQLGLQAGSESLRPGHRYQAQTFFRQLGGDLALVKRLHCSNEFQAHTGLTRALCWSDEGSLLASGGGDCKVKLWDARAFSELRTLTVVCHLTGLHVGPCKVTDSTRSSTHDFCVANLPHAIFWPAAAEHCSARAGAYRRYSRCGILSEEQPDDAPIHRSRWSGSAACAAYTPASGTQMCWDLTCSYSCNIIRIYCAGAPHRPEQGCCSANTIAQRPCTSCGASECK